MEMCFILFCHIVHDPLLQPSRLGSAAPTAEPFFCVGRAVPAAADLKHSGSITEKYSLSVSAEALRKKEIRISALGESLVTVLSPSALLLAP